MLARRGDEELIIMDELGYLESDAAAFKQAVFDVLSGDIPVLGVLRLGDVAWHREIKLNTKVKLIDVSEQNRDILPEVLANLLQHTGK